ncbi:MAG TPA: hypothetical protein VFL83_15290 [Anaeromyxobacter sp.]|nr:hypothetical protein [Anaeromyxobacter sp.]
MDALATAYTSHMTTKRRSTAVEEIKDVRHALLDLARALLEVATATIVTAAGATFMLVNEAVAKVRKQVRNAAA